jgi:hypothetical protein
VETERGTLIQANLTQQELAEMVGTTRETLAHTLGDFRRRGLLDTAPQQVVIRDAERLADVAGRIARLPTKAGATGRGQGHRTDTGASPRRHRPVTACCDDPPSQHPAPRSRSHASTLFAVAPLG